MAQEPKFEVVDGKVVEYVPQEVSGDSFQDQLDTAQNADNAAGEALNSAEQAAADAVSLAETTAQAVQDARAAKEATADELKSQEARKAAFDEAARLRDELAGSTPETEFAEPVDEGTETDSDGETVPVTVVAPDEAAE